MSPEEVELFFEQLRDAADNLSAVRGNIGSLKAKMVREGYRLVEIKNGRIDIEERLAHIEGVLRQALAPLGDSTFDDL